MGRTGPARRGELSVRAGDGMIDNELDCFLIAEDSALDLKLGFRV